MQKNNTRFKKLKLKKEKKNFFKLSQTKFLKLKKEKKKKLQRYAEAQSRGRGLQ